MAPGVRPEHANCSMKRRIIFGVIGYSLIGLGLIGFVLRALFMVKTGTDLGYRTHWNQPMTYLGALALMGMLAIVGVIGLYYRARRFMEQRRSARE
jgi:hypothetical protein